MQTKEEIIKYINCLKAVAIVHKEVFSEDRNLVTPVLISQSIVKVLLDLEDYKGKEYDARKNDLFYEIKASSSSDGQTTINMKSKPHVLVWIHIDYITDTITIRQKSNFQVVDSFATLLTEEAQKRLERDVESNVFVDGRLSITLANVSWDKDSDKVYDLLTLTPRTT